MKKLSKVLSVILMVSMLFGTVGYAADFSDVKSDNSYYQPITVLSALGIINGYEDGTFGPDRDVTRAEFATMLMRAMASAGLGSSDPAGTPFTDLNDANWAISDVRTAYDLGIINGMTETTFEPNNNVTYEQALKMIVCALNYGEQANVVQASAQGMPWYYGYIQTARSLGLTDNVTVIETQPAKRKEIAQMIYNALEVYVLEKVEVTGGGNMYMESTQTWMKDKLKVTKTRGEVLADESNTIDVSGATVRAGQALITDEVNKTTLTLEKNGISMTGLLGKDVEYYYKTDDLDTKTLVLIYSRSGSNSSVTVSASNISNITGSYSAGYTVSYYESDTAVRPVTLTVSANPTISFNGDVKTNVPASALNIEAGTIEFISDGSAYTKINVESLETYVVKSVNKSDNYIVDMYRASDANTLYIDEEDSNYVINMKNTSGSTVSLTSLSQYNVLTVRKGSGSAGRTTLDITVSTKNVSGTIKGIDDDYININGTEYPISAYMDRYSGTALDAFSVGDNCKAYLDKDGNIAYITKTSSSTTYYGYMSFAAVRDDVLKIALISSKTTTMGSPYVSAASKITVDGVPYSDHNLALAALTAGAALNTANVDGNGETYSQLIKYTLNSSGEITAIDTAVVSASEDAADETILKPFNVARLSDGYMTYKSSSYDFVGASNTDKFRINSSTTVFLVPLDRNDYDNYGRKSSDFFKDGTKYIVEAYNVTGSLNVAEVMVVYETAETEATVEYNTPLFIISAISQSTNSNGDPCDKVTGYQVSSSGSVTEKTVYTAATGVIYGNYSVGDVIMYVTDNQGYLKATSIVDLLDIDQFEGKFQNVDTNKVNTTTYYCELYSGMLIGADIDENTNTQMFDMALADTVEECATAQTYSMTAKSSVKYFVYDSSKSDNQRLTQAEAVELTAYPSYNDTYASEQPAATKMFVYKYNNVIRMIMIIK